MLSYTSLTRQAAVFWCMDLARFAERRLPHEEARPASY
jgi:hypothetical protein